MFGFVFAAIHSIWHTKWRWGVAILYTCLVCCISEFIAKKHGSSFPISI